MIVRLSPFRARAVATGLIALIGFGLFVFAVSPALNAIGARWDAAHILGKQLEATRNLAGTAKAQTKAVADLRSSSDLQLAAYRAASPPLGGAQLQGALTQIVQASGATMNAAQILPESSISGATQITVALNVTGPIAAQTKLLQDIQAGRPVLRVVKYSLRDPDGEWAAASQQAGPNILQAELTVSAFLIGE